MLLVSRFNIRRISRLSYLALIFSVFLLVVVLFAGIRVNGAKRWLGFGGGEGSQSFQPSEIAKLAVILSFAQWICQMGRKKMMTFKYGVVPFMLVTGLIVGLLMMEPHLSASIIIVVLAAILMFAGGTRIRWFLLLVIGTVAIVGMLLSKYTGDGSQASATQNPTNQPAQTQAAGGSLSYADDRISAWLDPEADPLGSGFQIRQSLYAVGSGGLLGQGLGQSRQKYMYLPEEHNDYIFAIVCEELGFIGAMLILMLFALLIVRGFWLALHAKDHYSSLVTIGITSLLAVQVFLNVAVVTNLLPATGVSLPFFSYGGTALWIQLFQMGIILAVSREVPLPKLGEDKR
jgi:cell division protein FtsW